MNITSTTKTVNNCQNSTKCVNICQHLYVSTLHVGPSSFLSSGQLRAQLSSSKTLFFAKFLHFPPHFPLFSLPSEWDCWNIWAKKSQDFLFAYLHCKHEIFQPRSIGLVMKTCFSSPSFELIPATRFNLDRKSNCIKPSSVHFSSWRKPRPWLCRLEKQDNPEGNLALRKN